MYWGCCLFDVFHFSVFESLLIKASEMMRIAFLVQQCVLVLNVHVTHILKNSSSNAWFSNIIVFSQ